MFVPTSSISLNLSSIEKKLAAIESSTLSTNIVKSRTRLTKVNNENELDGHLKSERASFNDQQFDCLTQEVLI